MRRSLDIGCQIVSRMMTPHMRAAAPEFTVTDIVYIALICNIDWFPVFSVVSGEFLGIKFFHKFFLNVSAQIRCVCIVFFIAITFTSLKGIALYAYQKVGEQTNKKESLSGDRLLPLDKNILNSTSNLETND